MKKILIILLILFISKNAYSNDLAIEIAPYIAINIEKIKYTWTQEPGQHWSFKIKCGLNSGSYTAVVSISDPNIRSIELSSFIQSPGRYFCITDALNVAGNSSSEEISFKIVPLQ